jgi:hypothetical protein
MDEKEIVEEVKDMDEDSKSAETLDESEVDEEEEKEEESKDDGK